jgi:NAD(P)H-dependent FMN reductase
LARAVAGRLNADLEEIRDTRSRRGLLGYLRSGLDAVLGHCTGLEPTRRDPDAYDAVVVGTPVWNASLSAPVRTYLAANGRRFKSCAFFATQGGRGAARALRQMGQLVSLQPIATLVLNKRQVRHDDISSAVGSFAREIELTIEPQVNSTSLSSSAAPDL